jgi:hypothetical protein
MWIHWGGLNIEFYHTIADSITKAYVIKAQ